MRYLQSFAFRHAFSIGFAILIAVFVSHYYAFSKECWIVLTVFFVGLTTRGTPLSQAMMILFGILVATLFSSLVLQKIQIAEVVYIILGTIFIINSYIAFISRPQESIKQYLMVFLAIILLITTLAPMKPEVLMSDRIIDVLIGAVIGIVCGQVIFPVRVEKEFRDGIVTILRAMSENTNFISAKAQQNPAPNQEDMITLQLHYKKYPEWVFETGFNPGLRSGFRFFLVNLDQITELLFSMDYFISSIDTKILQQLSEDICHAMKNNNELIGALVEYFENNKLRNTSSDFTSDISALENALHRIIPNNIELLDISHDYIALTALVRDIKDLRNILLQLVMALPTTQLVASTNKVM